MALGRNTRGPRQLTSRSERLAQTDVDVVVLGEGRSPTQLQLPQVVQPVSYPEASTALTFRHRSLDFRVPANSSNLTVSRYVADAALWWVGQTVTPLNWPTLGSPGDAASI